MKIAVIQGGPSAEAQVSRASAAGVAEALRKSGHDARTLELGPNLATELLSGKFDVAFPATHGRFGEDGCLQGLLEILGLPYVGSGVLASALGVNKVAAKRVFAASGLPLADQFVLRADCVPSNAAQQVRERLGSAVVVKPASQGSAIGVTRIRSEQPDEDLAQAVHEALALDDFVLCERFIPGKEVTCAVVDTPRTNGLRALPVTEIFAKAADWYDFTSRYARGGSVHRCPADLPDTTTARVQQIACAAHQALGCRDMSRVDFVVGEGDSPVVLLEVNTIPGMTPTSLYPEAAAAAGISFESLCSSLVDGAMQRASGAKVVQPLPMP